MVCFLSFAGNVSVWVWAAAAVLLAVLSVAVVLLPIRRRTRRLQRASALRARLEAQHAGGERESVEQLLAGTGYAYDREQNIYYSVLYPWQRKMGYCKLYDDWATLIGLVFDCEPVRFEYAGKRWLVEFWKGQYGITAGGEIGIYNTAEPDVDIPGVFRGTFYRSAEDDEMMDMAFILSRGDAELFRREGRHWWLTGFVLGEYAEPPSLTMDASVAFPDREMADAFLEAFRRLGYREGDYERDGNTVLFTFTRPRSRQPLLRRGPFYFITMLRTRLLVAQFRKLTEGLTDIDDILAALRERSPLLYHLAIRFGKQEELYRSFDEIRKYLR